MRLIRKKRKGESLREWNRVNNGVRNTCRATHMLSRRNRYLFVINCRHMPIIDKTIKNLRSIISIFIYHLNQSSIEISNYRANAKIIIENFHKFSKMIIKIVALFSSINLNFEP